MEQVKSRSTERYIIRQKLGRGLLATSYLADDRINNQRVVLKVLDDYLFDDAVLWSKIRARLEQIGRLRHPHILPILRGGQQNGALYWSVPYMSGGSLADRIRKQPLSADEIHRLLPSIAAALTYASQQGVTHAHLQPHNILFDATGRVKIADFSLLPIDDTGVETVDGALYVSPEQYIDQLLPIDERSDVYALGGILFRLVNGRAPYLGDSAENLAVQHLLSPLPRLHPTTQRERLQAQLAKWQDRRQNRDLAPFADYLDQQAAIPDAVTWQPVLEKALAKQPADRYPTVAALVAHLPKSPRPRHRPNRRIAYTLFLLSFILLLFASHNFHIAQLASPLRRVLGVAVVTQLEETYLTVQDQSQQAQHSLGLVEPSSPWEGEAIVAPTTAPVVADEPVVATTQSEPAFEVSQSEPRTVEEIVAETAGIDRLFNLPPLGSLDGEGLWEPYLYAGEKLVARRTFLQPDAERAMTVVAVVAFDLRELSLNYVWGRGEPVLPNGAVGTGLIRGADRERVIATFNGGFLSEHGKFGALAGDLQLPAQYDLATVAIDDAGRVAIGGWGTTLAANGAWRAWRQNAQMILQDGQVTSAVGSNAIADWGGTIDGDIVTWRSALGIDATGDILYYVAGSGLSMDALARTLQHAGADDAMLLDINAYWVHFAAVQNGEVSALFPEKMALHLDRYLQVSERDFFYLTARP